MNQIQLLLTALGPLASFYNDPDVSEIMVDAPDKVYVERNGKIEEAGVKFDSPEAVLAVIEAALALNKVKLGPNQTTERTRFDDGSRMLVVIPPTAVNGPSLVIQKLPKDQLNIERLIEFGALTREAHALLQSAIAARVNLLVAGGTASGKTTIVNALIADIPAEERVIVVEEVYDLLPTHPRLMRLCADGSPDLSFVDLIGLADKMRADRLVFGEVQGPEAMHMLELIRVGYDGSFMNIHADSPEDALARLEAMCLMANLGLGLIEIRNVIATTLQLIAFQQRLPNGKRRITQIVNLHGLEHDRYVLQPLFRYNPTEDKLERTEFSPKWE